MVKVIKEEAMIFRPCHLVVCVGEKSWEKLMRVAKLTTPYPIKEKAGAFGCTSYFDNEAGGLPMVVVSIDDEIKEVDGVTVAAMITHEAVHVWQFVRDYIGEDQPSKEFEAYSIQSITQQIMEAYVEQVFE